MEIPVARHDKLVVGLDISPLTGLSALTSGTGGMTILNGPVLCGATPQLGISRATVAIGPPIPTSGLTAPFSLEVTGISNFLGAVNVLGVLTCTGLAIKNAADISNGLKITNGLLSKLGIGVEVGGTVKAESTANEAHASHTITAANLTINGLSWFGYVVPKLAVAGKGFDIPHPTKPDTHRLRYICLEGPEIGTYLRGTLDNSNVIELPDYWTNQFIIPESITVNLTPIGSYQELFVETIEWGRKIIIKNNSSSQIKCYYTVFAERVTKDKLQVEYEGQTPDDYPGDNSEYSLAGWNYDRRA